jgi:hypothetical protein
MKVRIGRIVIVLVALVAFASSAAACEKCIDAGYNGWKQCSSGYASGSQYCYGGFGTACTTGGTCGAGGGGGGFDEGPFYPDYYVVTTGGDTPSQGFALRTKAGASAKTPVQQQAAETEPVQP